jgi:hypothetical protein
MVEARAHGQYGKTVEAIDEQPITASASSPFGVLERLCGVQRILNIYPLLAKYESQWYLYYRFL